MSCPCTHIQPINHAVITWCGSLCPYHFDPCWKYASFITSGVDLWILIILAIVSTIQFLSGVDQWILITLAMVSIILVLPGADIWILIILAMVSTIQLLPLVWIYGSLSL